MYRVLNNNKPAKYPDIKVHPEWNNCDFETLEEAQVYTDKWLGPFKKEIPLELNEKYDYNGCGDVVSIVYIELK